eukprot:tig00020801_g13983.t1
MTLRSVFERPRKREGQTRSNLQMSFVASFAALLGPAGVQCTPAGSAFEVAPVHVQPTVATSIPPVATTPARGDAEADASKPLAVASPEEFDALVKSTKGVIVADLYARWCRKCKAFAPKFERLSYEFASDATFVTVDVNAVADLPGRFEIKLLPTFVFIKDGKVVESYVGAEKSDAVQDHIRNAVQAYRSADFAPPADAKDAVPAPPPEDEADTDWKSLAERISGSLKTTSPTPSPSPVPESEPRVTEIRTPEEFDALVGGDALVAVDFYASWCRKCKYTMPKFAKASARHRDVKFAAVNVNEVARIPSDAGVKVMPSFQFWRKGEKLGGFEGAPNDFDATIKEHIDRFSA